MPTLYKLFEWLSRRAALLNVRDPDAELDKLAFIRIITGVVALGRVLPIVYGSYLYFDDRFVGSLPLATVLGIVVSVLLLCLTIGVLTPLAIVGLFVLYGPFDVTAQSETLGTQVFYFVLALLLLTGAGSRRSLDAGWLRRESGVLGKLVRGLYRLPGRLDANALRVCYFLVFTSFAAINLGAILLHLSDSYWRGGYTLQVMLTSSYLSRVYPLFRELETVAPDLLRGFSIVGGIGQAVFQALMLLLIFSRWGGWFVVLWGLNFFLASLFLLELSYLPYLELLLWIALFARAPSRNPVAIYYDDYCNLCKRTMQTLRAIDLVGTFEFRPASKNAASAATFGIDLDQLSVSLHGVFRDRVYAGYDLYLLIARRAPMLWIFAPLLWLLRVTRMGPFLYGMAARNRRRVFGTCEVAYDANRKAASHFPLPTSPLLVPSLGVVCAVFIALYYGTFFLRLPDLASGGQRQLTGIRRLGFDVPDVFNEADLRMGDHWPVLYRRGGDGAWQLVPMHARDGQKLLYPRLVDILYFGNSLRWRRLAMHFLDLETYTRPGGESDYLIRRVIAFDERVRDTTGGLYRVEIYRSASDPRSRDAGKYVPQLVYAYEIARP